MGKAVGIDLGTTNSCVAVVEGGEPVVIPNAQGERITPSVVTITATGERIVGSAAKRSAIFNPESTVYSIKRFIGRKVYEPSVEQDQSYVSYRVDGTTDGEVRIWVRGKPYSPQELSAMILRKLKTDAEAYLGQPVNQAVVTVPAYFDDGQRQATKDAGTIAGLEVLRILNEPTAAALAYGLDKRQNGLVAVYDLGGGTFDISMLELCEGTFEVKAVAGNTHLGGDDIDQRLIDWLCFRCLEQTGVDLRRDRMALQRLKDAGEQAKMELSTTASTEINLPFLVTNTHGPQHLRVTLHRTELEQLAQNIVERTVAPCRQALADAGITPDQLDHVILVGGQTRMPLVREKVRQLFGKEPYTDLNPEEVVALGAAVQAAVLTGEIEGILLLDVTPLTLSIETAGGLATPLIKRNTTIPTRVSQVFTTAEDHQANVEVHVVQGERAMAVENRSLGRFCLEDIQPAPRGVPQIEVTFEVDVNGIAHVAAGDKGTGKEQKVAILANGGLSPEDVQHMAQEAQEFAKLDSQRRKEIKARHEADTSTSLAERLLGQQVERIPHPMREELERKVAGVRRALRGNDVERIKAAARELETALMLLGNRVPPRFRKRPRGPVALMDRSREQG